MEWSSSRLLRQMAALVILIKCTHFNIAFGEDVTTQSDPNMLHPRPIDTKLRERLGLDPFYQKHLDVDGLAILGSANVSDNALMEAGWLVRHILAGRDDLLHAIAEQKIRAVVMSKDEFTTDIPEHRLLWPKAYWDRRARGLGATLEAPAVSCGEENLLNFEGDPYPTECIFVHEFAHSIHEIGLSKIDPTFDPRLAEAFEAAKKDGLWINTYAATNRHEYWAEGVQCWFDNNALPNAIHNEIRTRDQLTHYDVRLAKLCREVFKDNDWRYLRPQDRKAEDRSHLINYDSMVTPRFKWR